MDRKQIENILEQAKIRFLKNDLYLLLAEANERSITHKFAEHLQAVIGCSWDVDCEYNKFGSESKVIYAIKKTIGSETLTDDIKAKTVYPDIVVHKRGNKGPNLLVIEAKKDATNKDRQKDIEKLEKIRDEYKYNFAVFINFKIKAGKIEWEFCE
ncbi:MAG: hypothetical protein NTZ87_02925 [Candidatus Nomurabacteria bacterium]|nr:hypothetical protein [Candidatus Nomurabacteria bacterium]